MNRLENITNDEKLILREISYYFKYPSKLDIKMIKYRDNVIHLLLGRPGIFIGKKGRDINNITDIIKKIFNNSNIKFHIEESKIDMFLYNLSDLII